MRTRWDETGSLRVSRRSRRAGSDSSLSSPVLLCCRRLIQPRRRTAQSLTDTDSSSAMCTYIRLLKGLFYFVFYFLSESCSWLHKHAERERETVWHRLRQQEQHESLKQESTLKLNINTVAAESSDSFTCRRVPEQTPVGAGGRQTGRPAAQHEYFILKKAAVQQFWLSGCSVSFPFIVVKESSSARPAVCGTAVCSCAGGRMICATVQQFIS